MRKHHSLGEYGLGVVAQQRWAGGDEFVWGIGPQFTIRQQFGPRTAIQSKLRVMWNDWKEAEYREGISAVLDNRVSFAVSSSQIFYLLFGINRETTKQEHLSYWGGWGGAALPMRVLSLVNCGAPVASV